MDPFEEPSLDGLDLSLTLHESTEIDTALLSDIDGRQVGRGASPFPGHPGRGRPLPSGPRSVGSGGSSEVGCLSGFLQRAPDAGECVCVCVFARTPVGA